MKGKKERKKGAKHRKPRNSLLACLLACCLLATYKNKYENIKSRFILN
jgi:hypothetical protein